MTTAKPETRVHASAFGCITVPFLLVALIPLGWGARSNWMNGQLLRTGHAVSGRVTEVRHVPENPSIRLGRGSSESAVVTFTTRAGEERTAVSSVNRYPAPWSVGDTVDVIYDPDAPARADLRSELAGWTFWFGIWCTVALLPLAIASLPVVMLIRQRGAAPGAPRQL